MKGKNWGEFANYKKTTINFEPYKKFASYFKDKILSLYHSNLRN